MNDKMLFIMTKKGLLDVLNYLCNIYIKSLTCIYIRMEREIQLTTLIDRSWLTGIEKEILYK